MQQSAPVLVLRRRGVLLGMMRGVWSPARTRMPARLLAEGVLLTGLRACTHVPHCAQEKERP